MTLQWFRRASGATQGDIGNGTQGKNKAADSKAHLRVAASLSTSGSFQNTEVTLQKDSEKYAFFGQWFKPEAVLQVLWIAPRKTSHSAH